MPSSPRIVVGRPPEAPSATLADVCNAGGIVMGSPHVRQVSVVATTSGMPHHGPQEPRIPRPP